MAALRQARAMQTLVHQRRMGYSDRSCRSRCRLHQRPDTRAHTHRDESRLVDIESHRNYDM
eukprot:2471312-Amphidinium_carterae.1